MFQIHLWTGIAIGIYIILISVTGSVVVFRRDLSQWKLGNVPSGEAVGQRMTEEKIRELVLRKYPGWKITEVGMPRRRLSPAEVTIVKDGQTIGHRFNPYSGAYMGETYPTSVRVMEWLVDLHDNLLAGEKGREVNAVGGGLLVVLCISGVVIWWRGAGSWVKGLYFAPRSGWKRINFDIHSSLGFWSLLILLLWGVTGLYFAFPEPFLAIVNYFEPLELATGSRRGDEFLAWIARMHFGRYGGMGVRITYVVLGLLPAVLFVTGAIMWWNRVLRGWLAGTAVRIPITEHAESGTGNQVLHSKHKPRQ